MLRAASAAPDVESARLAAAAFPAWRGEPAGRPRLDGSLPAGDPRVNRARELLAERHEPLTMTPGDLRTLLARYQRRVAELLDVVDGTGAPRG